MSPPRYVSIEGADGCGKSTQAARLVEHLRARGHEVRHLREPGSTPLAERLRALLLDPAGVELDPWTEALLFSAARRELVEREIRPALERGAVVVAERCFLSTLVYQGRAPADPARGVPFDLLSEITRGVHGGTLPSLLVVLDVDTTTAARRRAATRIPDRIESHGDAHQARVRRAFVELAAPDGPVQALLAAATAGFRAQTDGVRVVDANGGSDAVHAAVVRLVDAWLSREGAR